jgi:TonB-linked SusC/RagA family outer membrane protein
MKKTFLRFMLLMLLVMSGIVGFSQTKKTVSGVVKDSSGNLLSNVTVTVRGTKAGTTTDASGAFKVPVNSAQSMLVFSSLGYETKTIPAGNGNALTVFLKTVSAGLEEVVVTALGIKKEQRTLGYATTVIKGDEITKTAPTNFASALYGKAPGVTITSNTGGATSAVGIQIRGINSIGYQRQPLMVVDGIIIRDGDANNDGYWGGNQKINGNGLLDINPDNIETINVLKGAAASALYGSDASFGVIVITTKNGKGLKRGIGVDVNLSANAEQMSTAPDLQTEYGPGYDWQTNKQLTGTDSGWINTTYNGKSVQYPRFRDYGQFGPKFDGRPILYWDGSIRPYVSHGNNWKQFYRTGYSAIENIALNSTTDKMSYRLSYTRNDYRGIQIGGNQQKNTLNLNVSYKLTSRISTDVSVSYINEKVHNRPRQIYYLTNNYGGFFSPADDMSVFMNKYQTSKGYKWVPFNSTLDLNERLAYSIRSNDFLDFLWNQLANSYDETTNRLIASGTLNYNILKGLNFRARVGTDYTGYHYEEKDRSTQPISYGPSGYYGVSNNQYVFTSGDLLLSYNRNITNDLGFTASVGYQSRQETYSYASAGTNGGLTVENWFSLKATKNTDRTGNTSRSSLLKDGTFGILNLSYKNYLFVEGTIRRERTSTLYPGNNVFYYPGVSGAFELSNAFRLPSFVTYSKLRAAWGKVGNPANPYTANVVYNAGNINGIPTFSPQTGSYGNNQLKNEEKNEIEFGWETKLLNNRLGFDVSYYNNTIKNQILSLTTPGTIGATGVLVNVGTMRNYGLELSIYGTPVKNRNFSWESRLNAGFNRNKVISLMPGLETLNLANFDNSSMKVVATPGKPSGNILGYTVQRDVKGNKVVDNNGYYVIDYSAMKVVGNVQPKVTGGFINTFNYKQFSLNTLVDYRWGGQVVSLARLYGLGGGLYKNTLFGRDAAHGGLPYYQNAAGAYVGVSSSTTAGPNGEKIYHDGIILSGVTASGAPNTTILDAPSYYLNTYTWGAWAGSGSSSNYPEGAVYDNNFIKLREVSLAYTLPVAIRSRMKMQNLVLSVYGRNLFYIYKSLPGMDPEEGVGTNYINNATSLGAGNAASRSYGVSIRLSF